jgi:hypothetical protein
VPEYSITVYTATYVSCDFFGKIAQSISTGIGLRCYDPWICPI